MENLYQTKSFMKFRKIVMHIPIIKQDKIKESKRPNILARAIKLATNKKRGLTLKNSGALARLTKYGFVSMV